jgi:hypothetical protein
VESEPGQGTLVIVELPGRIRESVAEVDEVAPAGEARAVTNMEIIGG